MSSEVDILLVKCGSRSRYFTHAITQTVQPMNPLLLLRKLISWRGQSLCKPSETGAGYMCPSPETPDTVSLENNQLANNNPVQTTPAKWCLSCCLKQQIPSDIGQSCEQVDRPTGQLDQFVGASYDNQEFVIDRGSSVLSCNSQHNNKV